MIDEIVAEGNDVSLPEEWNEVFEGDPNLAKRLIHSKYTKENVKMYVPETGDQMKDEGKVTFEVITFSPSKEQAAKWVISAVKLTRTDQKYDHEAALLYAYAIAKQSGFQFPVRGFVYENMGPGFEIYLFVDGVTAQIKNISRQVYPKKRQIDEEVSSR